MHDDRQPPADVVYREEDLNTLPMPNMFFELLDLLWGIRLSCRNDHDSILLYLLFHLSLILKANDLLPRLVAVNHHLPP